MSTKRLTPVIDAYVRAMNDTTRCIVRMCVPRKYHHAQDSVFLYIFARLYSRKDMVIDPMTFSYRHCYRMDTNGYFSDNVWYMNNCTINEQNVHGYRLATYALVLEQHHVRGQPHNMLRSVLYRSALSQHLTLSNAMPTSVVHVMQRIVRAKQWQCWQLVFTHESHLACIGAYVFHPDEFIIHAEHVSCASDTHDATVCAHELHTVLQLLDTISNGSYVHALQGAHELYNDIQYNDLDHWNRLGYEQHMTMQPLPFVDPQSTWISA